MSEQVMTHHEESDAQNWQASEFSVEVEHNKSSAYKVQDTKGCERSFLGLSELKVTTEPRGKPEIADDGDSLSELKVQFAQVPPLKSGLDKKSGIKSKPEGSPKRHAMRRRRTPLRLQKVDIDTQAYRQWLGVGKAQGLHSDAEIASFLLQHYESTKDASHHSQQSACCINCHASLSLPIFCSKCNPSPLPTKPLGKPGNKGTIHAKVRTKRRKNDGQLQNVRQLMRTISNENDEGGAADRTLDSMMDAVVAENANDDDNGANFLLLDLTDEIENDSKDDFASEATQQAKPLSSVLMEDGQKPFACKQCDLSYTRACSLKVHMRKHTGDKPFTCDQCHATFSLSGSLIVHKRMHSGERPYVCEQCGAAFSISSALKQHTRKHTGEKPFKCTVCALSYSRSDSLKVHMRSHSGYRPFVCEECGARFGRLYCLIAHKKKHSGERPFRCTECGASFTQSGKLTIHMRKHTGDRPYQCEQCGSSFTQSDRLKTHMRTHTGHKPFQCTECLKCFSHPHSLKVHMRSHTGDKPYKCAVCGLSFADPSYFRRHKAKHESSASQSVKHVSVASAQSVAVPTSDVLLNGGASLDTFSLIRSAFQCTGVYPT